MNNETPDLDGRMMDAPVVVRAREFGSAQFWKRVMGEGEYAWVMRALRDSTLSVGDLLKDAVERRHMVGVEMSYRVVEQRASNMLGGATPANMMVCASLEAGVAYFQTSDALERRLLDTDIAVDIASRFLRVPYDFCWIEFGETRSSPLRVFNRETGAHIAEGVIVRQRRKGGDAHGRMLDMVFVGSPKGKRWAMDDALQIFSLEIGDGPGETVADVIAASRARCDKDPQIGVAERAVANAMWDQSVPLIEHLCKVLLYLNLEDARKRPRADRTSILQEIARKGARKAAKLKRRCGLAYDRIVIGPEASRADAPRTHDKRPVSAHTRRGHFRLQPFGPGREGRKLLWIEPTVVGSKGLAAEAAPTPHRYLAR